MQPLDICSHKPNDGLNTWEVSVNRVCHIIKRQIIESLRYKQFLRNIVTENRNDVASSDDQLFRCIRSVPVETRFSSFAKIKNWFHVGILLKDLTSSIAELLPLPNIWSNAVVSDEKYFGQQTTNLFFTWKDWSHIYAPIIIKQ